MTVFYSYAVNRNLEMCTCMCVQHGYMLVYVSVNHVWCMSLWVCGVGERGSHTWIYLLRGHSGQSCEKPSQTHSCGDGSRQRRNTISDAQTLLSSQASFPLIPKGGWPRSQAVLGGRNGLGTRLKGGWPDAKFTRLVRPTLCIR